MLPDSVRLALPAEAAAIAAIQRRSWAQSLPLAVADRVLASIDLPTMTDSWESAILRPPLARFRVLVAIGSGRVVGFAALGPSDDPDADPGQDGLVAEFAIDPPAQLAGHGSRLLNACVDTLRADGFSRANWWVRSTDDAVRSFLTSAGWGVDGGHVVVGTENGDTQVKMIRLHTDITTS